jgi:dephospho-CoA kinase
VAALTGGIACGKSEVARILREEGVDVLEADTLAHEMMEPGTEVYARIVDQLGSGFLEADGRVDRRKLGRRVFENEEDRRALNAIVHPPVLKRIHEWAEATRGQGRSGVAVVPLLHEVGATTGWDAIVCVAASEPTILARLGARGLSKDEARLRLLAQMPVAEKVVGSDYVIYNEGSLALLKDMTHTVWKRITSKENEHHA